MLPTKVRIELRHRVKGGGGGGLVSALLELKWGYFPTDDKQLCTRGDCYYSTFYDVISREKDSLVG